MYKYYILPDPPDAGYDSLANAILLYAVSDLRLALNTKGHAAREIKQECLNFLLSWSQLSRANGVPVGTTWTYEQAESIGGARTSTVKILADVLGVTIEDLLEPMLTSSHRIRP